MSRYTAADYLDPATKPFPFCPGCSHAQVLDRLAAALARFGTPPNRTAIVTDIGCIGISDKHFRTHTFHGLHGRSLTYATGLKMARPELTVVALLGDGALGIGGHHFLNAARRNVDITVLVANNFNFGMTGGQHSVTTPHGGVTATTRAGNLESGIDVCSLVGVAGGNFAARCFAFDGEFEDLILEGLKTPGFAAVDAWEVCIAYYGKTNSLNRKTLAEMLAGQGLETGVIRRESRPAYHESYRQMAAELEGQGAAKPIPIPARFPTPFQGRRTVLIAGRAGQKVISTATLLGRAAMLCGLQATQRDDYPVTVMTGHSLAEMILEDGPIDSFHVDRPDHVMVGSPEGRAHIAARLKGFGPETTVYTTKELMPLETGATTKVLDPEAEGIKLKRTNTMPVLLAFMLRESGMLPGEAALAALDFIPREAIRRENHAAMSPFFE